MALIIFKYFLPTLLGYILFVGISGQLMPFRKPVELAERPSWLLALWTAVAVTLTLIIGLHMAYQMTLIEVQQMLKPSGMLLAAILAPGLIAYFIYARSVRQEIAAQGMAETTSAVTAQDVEFVDFTDVDARDTELEQLFDDIDNYEEVVDEEIKLSVTETEEIFADAFAVQINTDDAVFDDHEPSIVVDRIVEDVEMVTGIEHMNWDQAPVAHIAETNTFVTGIEHMLWDNEEIAVTEATQEWVIGIEHMAWHEVAEDEQESIPTEQVQVVAIDAPEIETEFVETAEIEEVIEVEAKIQEPIEVKAKIEDIVEMEAATEAEVSAPALTINADTAPDPESELAVEVEMMRRALSNEVALREETEKHLRITRRGLSALESEQNNFELQKADAVIEAEEKLEAQIKRTSTSEAHAERVEKQKTALEAQMLELKTSVVEAKREIRQSTAARAKALNTANKSVAFAQQAIKERGILEAQVKDAELALNKRQETISSLISALEKEKQRTQSDIISMAKQLVLHEKQLQARRSIEQASRKAEGKIGTRLVKKIATGANKSAA